MKRLVVAVPPLVHVLAAARVAAEHGAVPVEQDSETRGNTDRVDEDENVRRHLVGLVGAGVAVDRVVGLSPCESVSTE